MGKLVIMSLATHSRFGLFSVNLLLVNIGIFSTFFARFSFRVLRFFACSFILFRVDKLIRIFLSCFVGNYKKKKRL